MLKSAVYLVCVIECNERDIFLSSTEASYAYNKKKHLIPLLVDPNYKPEGWLGVVVAGKLYYNMWSDDERRENLMKIKKVLGPKGKVKQSDVNESDGKNILFVSYSGLSVLIHCCK